LARRSHCGGRAVPLLRLAPQSHASGCGDEVQLGLRDCQRASSSSRRRLDRIYTLLAARMGPVLYAIVVGLVVLAVFEAACRFLDPDDIALVRNPDHRLRPNSAETNADGIRMKREAREFTEDAVNVVFLGDSFVFGGREYPQLALPAQL